MHGSHTLLEPSSAAALPRPPPCRMARSRPAHFVRNISGHSPRCCSHSKWNASHCGSMSKLEPLLHRGNRVWIHAMLALRSMFCDTPIEIEAQ